jgi:hypothetical protein
VQHARWVGDGSWVFQRSHSMSRMQARPLAALNFTYPTLTYPSPTLPYCTYCTHHTHTSPLPYPEKLQHLHMPASLCAHSCCRPLPPLRATSMIRSGMTR